jgi:hypothetical protein
MTETPMKDQKEDGVYSEAETAPEAGCGAAQRLERAPEASSAYKEKG